MIVFSCKKSNSEVTKICHHWRDKVTSGFISRFHFHSTHIFFLTWNFFLHQIGYYKNTAASWLPPVLMWYNLQVSVSLITIWISELNRKLLIFQHVCRTAFSFLSESEYNCCCCWLGKRNDSGCGGDSGWRDCFVNFLKKNASAQMTFPKTPGSVTNYIHHI